MQIAFKALRFGEKFIFADKRTGRQVLKQKELGDNCANAMGIPARMVVAPFVLCEVVSPTSAETFFVHVNQRRRELRARGFRRAL